MADDVTFDNPARISYNFHTKLEIHKVVFLVLLCILLSKTCTVMQKTPGN